VCLAKLQQVVHVVNVRVPALNTDEKMKNCFIFCHRAIVYHGTSPIVNALKPFLTPLDMETKGFYIFRTKKIRLTGKKIRFQTEYLIILSENFANIVKANLFRFSPQGNATEVFAKKGFLRFFLRQKIFDG
jgi:hypothetical protein